MILVNKKSRSIFLLLAIVLCCLTAACSTGKDTGVAGNQAVHNSTSVSRTSTAAAALPAENAENDGTTAGAAVVQEVTGDVAKAATDKASASGSSADSGVKPGQDKGSEPKSTKPKSTEIGKLIGKDSEYIFYLDANKFVYAIDSAGKRTDCTMLSEYSGWATFYALNSDIYIFGESAQARKACSILPGNLFLGENNFHVYYISVDLNKAYSINEDGERHDSAIILYGGNYYFALDSSIYTVTPNGSGLRELYSEHEIAIGPHNEHILELARIEDGIIYYTDESTGDIFKCQYDLASGKAYYIDPITGKADPR